VRQGSRPRNLAPPILLVQVQVRLSPRVSSSPFLILPILFDIALALPCLRLFAFTLGFLFPFPPSSLSFFFFVPSNRSPRCPAWESYLAICQSPGVRQRIVLPSLPTPLRLPSPFRPCPIPSEAILIGPCIPPTPPRSVWLCRSCCYCNCCNGRLQLSLPPPRCSCQRFPPCPARNPHPLARRLYVLFYVLTGPLAESI
jgi:hypothetical protein